MGHCPISALLGNHGMDRAMNIVRTLIVEVCRAISLVSSVAMGYLAILGDINPTFLIVSVAIAIVSIDGISEDVF